MGVAGDLVGGGWAFKSTKIERALNISRALLAVRSKFNALDRNWGSGRSLNRRAQVITPLAHSHTPFPRLAWIQPPCEPGTRFGSFAMEPQDTIQENIYQHGRIKAARAHTVHGARFHQPACGMGDMDRDLLSTPSARNRRRALQKSSAQQQRGVTSAPTPPVPRLGLLHRHHRQDLRVCHETN
jgi:hypothetical protein